MFNKINKNDLESITFFLSNPILYEYDLEIAKKEIRNWVEDKRLNFEIKYV